MAFGMLHRYPATHFFQDEFDSLFWPQPTYRIARQPHCGGFGFASPFSRSFGPSAAHYCVTRRPSLFDLLGGLEFDDAEPTATESPSALTHQAPQAAVKSTKDVSASQSQLGAVSRKETETGLEYSVVLPGFDIDDVKLDFDLKGGFLTLSAEKETETKDEKSGATYRRHFSVKRQLPLDSHTKPEDISADLENGVLTVAIAQEKLIEAPSSSEPAITFDHVEVKSVDDSASMDVDSEEKSSDASISAEEIKTTVASSSEAPSTTPLVSDGSSSDVSVEDADDE